MSSEPPAPVVAYAPHEPAQPSPADVHYLKIVAVCNDVYAGLVLFGGIVATIVVGPGLDGPVWMIAFGLVAVAACVALHTRRARWLPIAVSAVYCLAFPFGTILGVSTLAVVTRPGVARLFARGPERHP